MHDLPILINITLALMMAFFGGLVARRLGLPAIVGYLLAGIVISPFTPGINGDIGTIQQLAELGVIFLMFGVGLHFSIADLWRVRDIAIPGALSQTLLSSLLGFALTRLWGWSIPAGIVLGLCISVASTVVLLRGLIDHSLLNTSHGQAAVGWLVMEDILSILILVLMPVLAENPGGMNWQNLAITLLKAAAFVAIMFFAGVRLIPWLLERIAHTRSRELFILAILAITLGTAMGASEIFGVSLALGAFAAGAIISESHLSHQVEADVFSFREAFSVLFFVSIGMLVNPLFLWQNLGKVASLSALVVFGKAIIVILLGTLFPRPAKTFLIIAVGLSQIGEFSFILGQAGLSLHILDSNQYSLILAAALVSITANPFMYKLMPAMERQLRRQPGFWKKLEANIPLPEIDTARLSNHVVVVGCGRIGKHLVDVLETLSIPRLVIEADTERMIELNQRGIPTLYADAGNSEVLKYAGLGMARALVCTVPDETSAMLVVAAARELNPNLLILARAANQESVSFLTKLGADHVILPELEGGLELTRHMLISLGFPLREVYQYTEAVRHDQYNLSVTSDEEHRTLHDLNMALRGVEIAWIDLDGESPLVGRSLAESDIRSQSGASVVALVREKQLVANPKSMTVFEAGDRIGLIGDAGQIESARKLV